MAYGSILTAEEDGPRARKGRGAFFTPPELAKFLVDFAVRTGDDCVLEPSCGEAEFLKAAALRLKQLGASSSQIDANLVGCELHGSSASAARARLAQLGFRPQILASDFFDLKPSGFGVERFDAVVGNPPYIRYQNFSGAARLKALECAFTEGVRLDKLSSSWAPFLIQACRFLKPGGRLAFVLPAELLSSNYAAPVRAYLLSRFLHIRLVLFERNVFPEVQEEVVLLLAEGFGLGCSEALLVSQVERLSELGALPSVSLSVAPGARWPSGHAADDASRSLDALEGKGLARLSCYGEVRLGAVTGANNFFTLSEAKRAELGLGDCDVVPLCPPGSRHLRSLSFGSVDFARLRDAGAKVYLFSPEGEPSQAARSYIKLGEALGVSQAYKCRIRSPWWRVPGVKRCDAFFTYMNGAGPNLCRSDLRLGYLNSVHGITFKDELRELACDLLPIACMGTTSLLSAELVGRSYGGGILKLEPREASRMLVPSHQILEQCKAPLQRISAEVDELLRLGKRDSATLLVDEALLPALGIDADEGQRMHGKLLEIRGRRQRKSSSADKS